MKEAAIRYYKDFQSIKDTRNNSIAFLGQVGAGKTHLSIALAVNLLQNNVSVIYMPYRDTVMNLKQNIMDDEIYSKSISSYQTCEVLLIDDLFKGKITETDINITFEILNHRYMNYKPVIVSSQYSAEDLLDVDEAIGSRIIEMCKSYTIEITGKENNFRLR